MHPSRIPIVAKRCLNRNRPTRNVEETVNARGMNSALTVAREACKIRGASLGEGTDAKLDFVFMYGARAAVLRDRAPACRGRRVRHGGKACAERAAEDCNSSAQARGLAGSEGASGVGRVQEQGQEWLR